VSALPAWLAEPLRHDRVLIRKPGPDDRPAVVALFQDTEVRRYLGGALDEETALGWATTFVSEPLWGKFVIVADGEVVGIGDIVRRRGPWEMDYQLRRDRWGRGLAGAALRLVISWFFAAMDEPVLIAVTQAANERSCRLLERLGARQTETFEEYGDTQRQYEFARAGSRPE
jgi:ribosomal-protein-alanine N-acetyltransferase